MTQGRARLRADECAKGDVALGFTGAKPRLTGESRHRPHRCDRFCRRGRRRLERGADRSRTPEALDAELSLAAIPELAWGKLVAGAARLDVTLEDGAGGRAAGLRRLRRLGKRPADCSTDPGRCRARGYAGGIGLDGGKLAAGLAASASAARPTSISISARGASQQELVARLRGRAHVRLATARASTSTSRRCSATSPAKSPTAGRRRGRRDAVHAAGGELRGQADGIAETEDLQAARAGRQGQRTGSVDLLSPARSGCGRDPADEPTETLPVAVVIAGPWSAPKIYPDVTGILDNPNRPMRRCAGASSDGCGQA
jgi:AsmA protein